MFIRKLNLKIFNNKNKLKIVEKERIEPSLKYRFPSDFYNRPEDLNESNNYSIRVYDFGFDINSISTQDLNKEIKILLHEYKLFIRRILNKEFDFFKLSEMERCIIKTLRVNFSENSPLSNYIPVEFTATTIRLRKVTNNAKSNDIKEVTLTSVRDVIFFECAFPFNTLKEFALYYNFFSQFSIDTPFGVDPLDEILKPLISQISHIR